MTAFKKQLQLIDILKRQKVHTYCFFATVYKKMHTLDPK